MGFLKLPQCHRCSSSSSMQLQAFSHRQHSEFVTATAHSCLSLQTPSPASCPFKKRVTAVWFEGQRMPSKAKAHKLLSAFATYPQVKDTPNTRSASVAVSIMRQRLLDKNSEQPAVPLPIRPQVLLRYDAVFDVVLRFCPVPDQFKD
jgi:hypothetical protein